MAIYRLKVLDETIDDLQEAINWYSNISSELSIDIEVKFFAALQEIIKRPLAFQIVKAKYRKYNIARFPYSVVFKIVKDRITIVAFAHHKRKPNYWKKRK